MIGTENSHHFPNQSHSKLKPNAIWPTVFSRGSDSWLVLNLSSHWLIDIFFRSDWPFSISLTLALRHSIEGPSTNCVFIVPNRSPKSSMWTTTVISLPVQKTMCFDGDIAVIFPEEEVVWVTVSLGAQHHSGHVKSQG